MTEPSTIAPETNNPAESGGPLLDAAAIYAVSTGELNLRKPARVASEPLEEPSTLPLADATGGRPRQPHRQRFGAADILVLSRTAHPWQAPVIEQPQGVAAIGRNSAGGDQEEPTRADPAKAG